MSQSAAGRDRQQRLEEDRDLLTRHRPRLQLRVAGPLSTATIEGPLELELHDGTVVEVPIKITLGPGYPSDPPKAYEVEKRWRGDPDRHVEEDGRLCLSLRGFRDPDLEAKDSLLRYIEDVELFVRQQLILDSQRRFKPDAKFPGPEWPHGAAGLATAVIEDLERESEPTRAALWEAAKRSRAEVGECPCGSGAPYAECHFRKSKLLRRAMREGLSSAASYDDLVQAQEEP